MRNKVICAVWALGLPTVGCRHASGPTPSNGDSAELRAARRFCSDRYDWATRVRSGASDSPETVIDVLAASKQHDFRIFLEGECPPQNIAEPCSPSGDLLVFDKDIQSRDRTDPFGPHCAAPFRRRTSLQLRGELAPGW